MVLGAAITNFTSIAPHGYDILHPHYRKLCHCLPDVDEGAHIIVLGVLLRYARTQFLKPAEGQGCCCASTAAGGGRGGATGAGGGGSGEGGGRGGTSGSRSMGKSFCEGGGGSRKGREGRKAWKQEDGEGRSDCECSNCSGRGCEWQQQQQQ